MTLSVVFLLTTLPNVVYFLKIDDWVPENDDPHTEARLSLGFAVTNLLYYTCLLYTSPSPRDRQKSRMPSSA